MSRVKRPTRGTYHSGPGTRDFVTTTDSMSHFAVDSPIHQSSEPGTGPVVARKLNAEIVLLLGWGPAILCQFAHPMVAAGVADHSSFRADRRERIRRLHSTLDAMLALTFGTPDQVQRAARGIRAIHDRVHGSLEESSGPFSSGAAYSAHDPELLRWVHSTMLDLLPRTYELFVGPLSSYEKDTYCAEASGVEPLLGMPLGFLPRSEVELHDYLEQMLASGEIVVTPTARMLARELMSPRGFSGGRTLLWLSRLTTVGLLPSPIREMYGFSWTSRHERILQRSAGLIRGVVPRLPSLLRHWPAARAAPSHA